MSRVVAPRSGRGTPAWARPSHTTAHAPGSGACSAAGASSPTAAAHHQVYGEGDNQPYEAAASARDRAARGAHVCLPLPYTATRHTAAARPDAWLPRPQQLAPPSLCAALRCACHGPNQAQVFLTDTHLVLAMEYAAGGDLAGYSTARQGLPEVEARYFFQQIILALDYCHRMVRFRSRSDCRARALSQDCHGCRSNEVQVQRPQEPIACRRRLACRRLAPRIAERSTTVSGPGWAACPYTGLRFRGRPSCLLLSRQSVSSRDIKLENILVDGSPRPLIKVGAVVGFWDGDCGAGACLVAQASGLVQPASLHLLPPCRWATDHSLCMALAAGGLWIQQRCGAAQRAQQPSGYTRLPGTGNCQAAARAGVRWAGAQLQQRACRHAAGGCVQHHCTVTQLVSQGGTEAAAAVVG